MGTAAAVSRIRDLSPAEVKSGLDRGEIVLIDVREPFEHAGGRIPGARLMPLSAFDPARARQLAGDRQLVLHCKGGGRSSKAAHMLLAAGADHASHLAGGFDAWKSASLPTERDVSAPISIMRQVQITAGSIVLAGSLLGFFVSPWFFLLSGFIGAGLVMAGVTDTCGMAMMLSKMPWNRAGRESACLTESAR
jgi:rhodanese-related sulfurtransferase